MGILNSLISMALLIAVLIYAFTNGFRDAGTLVATVVSTRALTPAQALIGCAVFEFLGALFLGSAVSKTLSSLVVNPNLMSSRQDLEIVVLCGVAAAIFWSYVSWLRAWPTSNNQALIAGLTGAGLALWGPHHIQAGPLAIVFAALLISPLVGFAVSLMFTKLIRFLGEWMTPKVSTMAEWIHLGSCALVSSAQGSNNGQMALGVLLPSLGLINSTSPHFLRTLVSMALAAGILFGGRRLLKKMGMSFYRIQVTQGLGAQLTSAFVVFIFGRQGLPVSATQVLTGSIVGAGAAKNPRSLKWPVVGHVAVSWLITPPAVAFVGYLFVFGTRLMMRWTS